MRFAGLALLACATLATSAVIRDTSDDFVIVQWDNSTGTPVQLSALDLPEISASDLKALEASLQVSTTNLETRNLNTVSPHSQAGSGIASAVTKLALSIATITIKKLDKWNIVRQAFTQTTTKNMWSRNPDKSKYKAVVCYNKGYNLKYNTDAGSNQPWGTLGWAGKWSAKINSGVLSTDYDCMFITRWNAFYTYGDGGYQNLAYIYNTKSCSYNSKTLDLYCAA